jgi:catechol 2,3-dioxygenase-like lactoylglutathione lyase family enzyme
MIANGNVTIYVADMDAAIRFYTDALAMKLTNRFGRQWATLDAGPSYWTTDEVGAGLTIGLHPHTAGIPQPGTVGSIGFGIETYEPLERVSQSLRARGVRFTSEIVRFEAGNSVGFEDLYGHKSYVHEFPPFMLEGVEREPSSDSTTELVGGHAIVYVSNMDAAVRFYSESLGLKLTNRYGDQFATVEAGSLVIVLHPETRRTPQPGAKGSIVLGLVVDGAIDRVVARLGERGVGAVGEISRSGLRAHAVIEDPDGNVIFLWEEAVAAYAPERSLARAAAV